MDPGAQTLGSASHVSFAPRWRTVVVVVAYYAAEVSVDIYIRAVHTPTKLMPSLHAFLPVVHLFDYVLLIRAVWCAPWKGTFSSYASLQYVLGNLIPWDGHLPHSS